MADKAEPRSRIARQRSKQNREERAEYRNHDRSQKGRIQSNGDRRRACGADAEHGLIAGPDGMENNFGGSVNRSWRLLTDERASQKTGPSENRR